MIKNQGCKAKKACCPETPRVGLEPTREKKQAVNNKTLTENDNSVLDTSLDKIEQKYPELVRLIQTWPNLSEHKKQEIKALIETNTKARQ